MPLKSLIPLPRPYTVGIKEANPISNIISVNIEELKDFLKNFKIYPHELSLLK